MTEAEPRSITKTDWICVAALLALILPLRVWLLCNTEVTARDSIGYIRYALEFERIDEKTQERVDWKQVLRANHQHPGYPLLLLLMSQPIRAHDGATTPENMELSAQLVNLIASLLLILPMYFLGRQFFDRTVSFGAVLLYQYLPISAQHLSDGISEPTYLLFLVSGLLQMVHTVRERSVRRVQLCGLFAGLAYLVRPEGALILPAVGAVLILLQLRGAWRCPWRQFIECGMSAVVCAAMVGSIYVIATGHFSNKPTVIDMGKMAQVHVGQALFAAAIPNVHGDMTLLARSAWALGIEVNQGFHYIAGLPALLGLLWSFGCLRRDAGFWALALFTAMHVMILLRLGMVAHYISDRHVTILVLGGCFFVVAGLRELPSRILAWRKRADEVPAEPNPSGSAGASPSRARLAGVAFAVLFLAMVGFCLPKALQRLHGNRLANHEAGLWLASVLKVGDHIEDDHAWSHYFAGGVFREKQEPRVPPGRVPTTWVVTTRSRDAGTNAEREKVLTEQAKLMKWWPEASEPAKAQVMIYAQPGDPLKNPWR